MLLSLALIPVIGLMIFIYLRDKKEKEPFGLLTGLFFAGMGTVTTAIIAEHLGQAILDVCFPYESALKAFILATVIVGPAEELGKYMVLRLITWKNRQFNYSYDAIVYAVFVSLGFAALENIEYVFNNGVGTALLRMFTSVPGHACFAVFMGFFYSKAKYSTLTNDKKKYILFNLLSIMLPIIIHGLYDAILMSGAASGEPTLAGLSMILWLGFITALFASSIILIIRSSKNDYCIVSLPNEVQTVYRPVVAGRWSCVCGVTNNQFSFCPACGRQRPNGNAWYCPRCGTLSTYNFCGNCGCPVPANQPQNPVI
ncbi:MAG: PrsW family intramembrane metalloprotease [Saccharofermentans sp.]|nr:PrsW family intramembrane metalloprotease [Saccharofermentans sp.]